MTNRALIATTDDLAIDAYGHAFTVPAEQLQRQRELREHSRIAAANAARDAAAFAAFCAVIAKHFGLTVAQVQATSGVAHEAWQNLGYEAARRRAEAARGSRVA